MVFTRVTAIGPVQGNLSLADLLLLPALVTFLPALRGRWPIYYWLLGLLVVNVASWLNGFAFITSQTLVDLIKLCVNLSYALVGLGIGRTEDGERAFAKGVLITLVPVAVVMVIAAVTGTPRWFLDLDLIRVRGPMTDPNGMCIYLAGILPLVATLSPGWLVFILAAALTTASRTGIVSITIVFLAWCVVQRRILLLVAVLAAAGTVAVYLLASPPVQRLLSYERTLSNRAETWTTAWHTVGKHPLIGVGKGNYAVVRVKDAPDPHNTYLELLVGNGVIGLAAFVLPVGYWLLCAVALRRSDNWWISVLASLVAGLAVSLLDWRLFWLSLGAMHGRQHAPRG